MISIPGTHQIQVDSSYQEPTQILIGVFYSKSRREKSSASFSRHFYRRRSSTFTRDHNAVHTPLLQPPDAADLTDQEPLVPPTVPPTSSARCPVYNKTKTLNSKNRSVKKQSDREKNGRKGGRKKKRQECFDKGLIEAKTFSAAPMRLFLQWPERRS